jgi:hypothetical protein
MISNSDISKLYTEYLEFSDKQMATYPALAVTSVMLSLSLSLYKTVLSEEDFESFLESIVDNGKNVKPIIYKPTNNILH